MAILFKDLSTEQRSSFEEACQRHGIDPASVRSDLSTANEGKGLMCGHPATSAAFPPSNIVHVENVSALKALSRGNAQVRNSLTGAHDETFYPDSAAAMGLTALKTDKQSGASLQQSLTRQQSLAIGQALNAYVLGDASRVQDYEPYINDLHFPMQVTAYAVQNLTVTADSPLIVNNPNNPTSLIYGTVTVEPGGYIEAITTLQMDVQVFNVVA